MLNFIKKQIYDIKDGGLKIFIFKLNIFTIKINVHNHVNISIKLYNYLNDNASVKNDVHRYFLLLFIIILKYIKICNII